jgi:hypothetical protein
MVGGRHFANDLAGWAANRPADARLIASFHNYNFQPCRTEACWDASVAPVAAQAPVVTGEFGEIDCTASYVKRFMRWADRRGVGYLMWAWWVLPDRRCSTLAVLAKVNGKPRSPNGTALRAHLRSLVPRLSLGGPKTQTLDVAVEVRVRCGDRCVARAEGQLIADGALRLEPVSRALQPGRTRTVRLGIPAVARRAAATALGERTAVSARITVVVTDGSHTARRKRSVNLVAHPEPVTMSP